MPESSSFWDLYWEMRLNGLQNLGKRQAVLATSRLILQMAAANSAVRLLELGCGEGQIIGALAEGHGQVRGMEKSVGVDYVAAAVEKCRRAYPGLTFLEGDFTDPALMASLGQFEIVLMVNALHEVFSTTFSEALGEVDIPAARARVEQAFALAAGRVMPGGWLVLFDGLEPPGDPRRRMRVRFLTRESRAHFETFAREYRPFRITYRATGEDVVELSQRDFTRYLTKSIFLGKKLWQTERLESYQYFTESDFHAAFERSGLVIHELRTLTVDEDKWRRSVRILTPGVRFPEEHILILAQKPSPEK